MENQILAQSYFEQPNPYVNAPSCHVNLLELSRYAKKCGKKLVELTQEEVKKFCKRQVLFHKFWHLIFHKKRQLNFHTYLVFYTRGFLRGFVFLFKR